MGASVSNVVVVCWQIDSCKSYQVYVLADGDDKWEIMTPSSLIYTEKTRPAAIPVGAQVVYAIELVKINETLAK